MSRCSPRFLCHALAAALPSLLAAAPQPSEDEVRGTLHEVLSRWLPSQTGAAEELAADRPEAADRPDSPEGDSVLAS